MAILTIPIGEIERFTVVAKRKRGNVKSQIWAFLLGTPPALISRQSVYGKQSVGICRKRIKMIYHKA